MKTNLFFSSFFMFLNVLAFSQGSAKTKAKTTTKTVIARQSTNSIVAADAIKYDASNKEEEINVDGKDVVISGNDNKLSFKGVIEKIIISGKENDITIESVNQITITGNGNFVSWEKTNNASAKPIIQDKGGYNNIEKRSGNSQAKDEN